METICCATPYGNGGLGRILEELVESARARGVLERYFAFSADATDNKGVIIGRGIHPWLSRYTPLRYCPGWQSFLMGDRFDRTVAGRLTTRPNKLIGFAGQALHTFQKARSLGCPRLELVAANSHANNIMQQHRIATSQWPIERAWFNDAHRRRMIREYKLADAIHVASPYSMESFVREGVPKDKLMLWPLHPHPRFTKAPQEERPRPDLFRVIYVGSITVVKGLPVLLEAFARLREPAAELLLVGGTATRGMRQYLQRRMAEDRRIRLTSGDPLPHLRRGMVFVHPSYEDGFGYAPLEALQCGLWTLVTDQTGMKESIRPGVNGDIIPAGDVEMLARCLSDRLKVWKAGQSKVGV